MPDRLNGTKYTFSLLSICVWLLGAWGGKPHQTHLPLEDLSVHRIPPAEVSLCQSSVENTKETREAISELDDAPPEPVTKILNQMLQAKTDYAREHPPVIQGYTIQVYMGSNRSSALSVKQLVAERFPALHPKVYYDLPHYAVRIGRYLSKIEALSTYMHLKPHWPDTIVRPSNFQIKELLERFDDSNDDDSTLELSTSDQAHLD